MTGRCRDSRPTTGFALRTARTPDLGTVQRRDGAIRVPITNFDADWDWTAEATDGDAALITVEGCTWSRSPT